MECARDARLDCVTANGRRARAQWWRWCRAGPTGLEVPLDMVSRGKAEHRDRTAGDARTESAELGRRCKLNGDLHNKDHGAEMRVGDTMGACDE